MDSSIAKHWFFSSGLVFLAGCVASAACIAAEPLSKRGSYSGKYVFSEKGNAVPVENNYLFTSAVNQGLFLNAAGTGFLHGALVACTAQGTVQNDQFSFSGHCTATDKEGDKAALKWTCSKGGDRCVGAFDWVGGTGKYAGIRGRSQFDGAVLGEGPLGPIGDANWKGEWQLP